MTTLLLFALFAEIALLVKLSQLAGGGFILLEIGITAVLGYWFLRRAGRAFLRTDELIAVMARPAETFRRSGWPLVIAGLLLILPGILSDLFGLFLFVRSLAARGGPPERPGEHEQAPPGTIDVEYQVHDDERNR